MALDDDGIDYSSSSERSKKRRKYESELIDPIAETVKPKLNDDLLLFASNDTGPRDYNKLNERMLDCYVSPKSTWDGIKALHQAHTHTEDRNQGRFKVGPFYVSNIVNEYDLQLIQYAFEYSSATCILFLSARSVLYQSQFTTLRPRTHLDPLVIDIFADILTDIERRKNNEPLNWYLPVTFSSVALNSDESSFLKFVERHNMRENYMFPDLKYCEKIFIPVCGGENSREHYYLYTIHMKNQEIEAWDSLGQVIDINERDQTTLKLLLAMDRLFGDVMFIKFDRRIAHDIILQPNAYDSGIFVINYMQQLDKYVGKKYSFQSHCDEERLNLALKLLKNDLNQETKALYEAARRHNAQVKIKEDSKLWGTKRKRNEQDSDPPSEAAMDNSESRPKGYQQPTSTNKTSGKNTQLEFQVSDPPQEKFIHVRARRDQASDSHSLAERVRREKINERMKLLQDLVPGCSKVTGKVLMLDEIINHVQSLQRQVQAVRCKTISEDVGRGACKELDDSDNRLKRNNAVLKTGCSKGYVMPTHDLVGKEFQRHAQQILTWIKNEVPAIGIWGMGGSGKSTLATHVHNKLLEVGDDFDHIIWVTVSQYDNSIYKMQKAIARTINLDISDEHDVKRISGKLFQASKHKNCIIILDDVWNPIFLEEVGFPLSSNGIKLILTTRSWEVCQSMNCLDNIIELKPLDEEEGWDLFKRTLEMHHIQSSEVEPIARGVAKQCEGLPLAIVLFAKSMKGKEDIREWNHLLECLQNLDNNGQYYLSKMVFPVLKSSYTCLNNNLQKFFLYYALSAEEDVDDSYVQPLIRKFFYEGWTDQKEIFEINYDEGYTMLDELRRNSLLTEKYGRRRMHTLLKAMAINIAKNTDEIMVKPDMNLVELPRNAEWREGLQKVFLTKSNIQKILVGTSPNCSKLSTLLLDCNYDLKWIPDDFFSNTPALKILDLSKTGIKHLPESVSSLECLIALLLSGCEELRYVPSLAKLQQLIELDLSFTAIAEAPCGLELLVNLKYLNLACTDQLKMSSLVISKMTNLQSLRLMNWIPESMDARAQDLLELRKLEIVSVNFCDIEEFNAYIKSFLDNDGLLKSYCLSSATLFDYDTFVGTLEFCALKRIVLCGIDLTNRAAMLPEDINELIISKCDNRTKSACLCHTLSFSETKSDSSKVEWLKVSECDKLEYLCCASPSCLFCSSAILGGRLSLIALKDLKQITATIASSLDSPIFYLKDLHICKCSRMTILMMRGLLEELKSLETISVESCESMVAIAGENYSSGNTSDRRIILPKVRSLKLHALRELTSVFRGTMICPSLEYFHASDCENLDPPHIEIQEGCKLEMEMSTGYHWGCDNQDSEFHD